MTERFFNYLEERVPLRIKGEKLIDFFRKEYELFLERRLDDWRYPRLTEGEVSKIASKVMRGQLVPVRATRRLIVDKSHLEFFAKSKQVFEVYQGRMKRTEAKSVVGNILESIQIGDMRETFVWNFGGEFENIAVRTDDNLIVEEGAFGVIENTAWGILPSYFRVLWEGFNPAAPGKVSLLPVVSFKQGSEYELEVFHKSEPEDFGLTVADQIKKNRLDITFTN